MSAPKLDIRDVLAAADRKDYGYLDRLPDELAGAFTPYQAMRWFSAADGDAGAMALQLVNNFVNEDYNALTKHPRLHYKLLAACGRGRQLRHQWVNPARAKRGAGVLDDFLAQHWPEANRDELNIVLAEFTRDSFQDFVQTCGLVREDAEKIVNAYDAHHGIAPEKAKKAKKR